MLLLPGSCLKEQEASLSLQGRRGLPKPFSGEQRFSTEELVIIVQFRLTKNQIQTTRLIAPENIPIQYGGLRREKEDEFSPTDEVSEMAVRGGDTATIQIPTPEVPFLTLLNEPNNLILIRTEGR